MARRSVHSDRLDQRQPVLKHLLTTLKIAFGVNRNEIKSKVNCNDSLVA